MIARPRRRATVPTVASLALALCLAGPALAAQRVVRLDPAATDVSFHLDSALHGVEGVFELERGRIAFDPDTGVASGSVVLDATSARTGNGMRDKKMHGKVLESERFPRIELLVERVEGSLPASGRATLVLHGTLVFHGDRHPVRLPTAVQVGDGGAVSATTELVVPYVEWGLDDPSLPLLKVDKEVRVTVRAEGRLD